MLNAFSIDLEDYFHTEVATRAVSRAHWEQLPQRVEPMAERLLELMAAHGVRATVFVLGWVARQYPAVVRRFAEAGHEIACHSDVHCAVFRMSPAEFRADTRAAQEAIEAACGERVAGYRAPSFSITPGTEWAWHTLSELGFAYDSSVNPVRHKFYGNPHAPRAAHRVADGALLEVPVATVRWFRQNWPVSGGAYLRLLPLPYVQAGLRDMRRRGEPATLYVHPWELDHQQPRLALDWKSHVRQRWGARGMERKLERLFREFRFAPIREVYAAQLAAVETLA